MAKKLNAVTVAAIFLVVFLIASYSVGAGKEVGAEGEVVFPEQLCERASQTWTGDCKNTKNCDNQCIQWESARHGACHKRDGKWKCFCYFDNKC